jgi:type IX secretion system PorP/SprF family membrane protein
MYLNPAFTSAATFHCNDFKKWFSPGNIRFTSSFRNQWSGKYLSNLTCFEHSSIGSNWSFGSFLQTDQIPEINLLNQYMGLAAAYGISEDDFTLKFGYQIGLGRRNLNKINFNFADEFNGTGFNLSSTQEVPEAGSGITYFDYSSIGINLRKGLFSLGLAGHHLTKPKFSLWGGSENLSRKFSIQLIKAIELQSLRDSRNKAMDLLFLVGTYKYQGGSNQLDVGAYLEIGRKQPNDHFHKFSLGSWFRGIPVKSSLDGSFQRDVVVLQGAFQRDLIRVAYSYDIPISKARVFGKTHEVSISYQYSNAACRSKVPPPTMPCNHKRRKSKVGGIKKVWGGFLNIFS